MCIHIHKYIWERLNNQGLDTGIPITTCSARNTPPKVPNSERLPAVDCPSNGCGRLFVQFRTFGSLFATEAGACVGRPTVDDIHGDDLIYQTLRNSGSIGYMGSWRILTINSRAFIGDPRLVDPEAIKPPFWTLVGPI